MHKTFISILVLSTISLSTGIIAPANAGTVGAAAWNGCKNMMLNKYNNLRGAKVFVAGYNSGRGHTRCFWTWNKSLKATKSNAQNMVNSTLNDCKREGYDYCQVFALNGSLTDIGLYARNLAVAEYHDNRQARQAQNNADVDAFMGAFIGVLGGMQSNPQPVYRPRYQPGYNNAPAKDTWNYNNRGCTPAQKARGWSEERCALN